MAGEGEGKREASRGQGLGVKRQCTGEALGEESEQGWCLRGRGRVGGRTMVQAPVAPPLLGSFWDSRMRRVILSYNFQNGLVL